MNTDQKIIERYPVLLMEPGYQGRMTEKHWRLEFIQDIIRSFNYTGFPFTLSSEERESWVESRQSG
jgi:hypothetical protein